MSHLFYILGIICFLFEISVLQYPRAYYKKLQNFKKLGELSKENKEEGGKFLKENNLGSSITFHLFYLCWTITGCILSSQWMLFVCLLIFGIFSSFYRKRFYQDNTMGTINFLRFDAIVSSLIVGILILNHFHHIL